MIFPKKYWWFTLVFYCIAYSQSTPKELNLKTYLLQDTTRCFLLDKAIQSENDQNVWIKNNNELKKLAQEKSQTETNSALKKAYFRYLSTAYNNEGAYFVYTEEYEKAISFYKKSLQIANKINYDTGSALALQNIGTAFDYLGKLDSNLVYMQKAYFYAKRSKNLSNIAYVLTDLGFIYNNLGNNSLAIQYNIEALTLFEKLKDFEGLERSYFALGRIFENQNDYKTSIFYYEKCLAIDRKLKNNERITLVLISLAANNVKVNNLEKALQYNNEAFQLAGKNKNNDFLASSYKIYGDIYYEKKDLENSKINYQKSLTIFQKVKSEIFISKISTKLAKVYLQLGNYNLALEKGLIGYQLSQKTNYPSDKKEAAETLSAIYSKLQDYKNAYLYKAEAADIAQKIYFDESKDIALKATHRYETEKKEAKIKDLNLKKKIAELQSKKKSIIIYSVLLLFLAIATIAYFLFSRFKTQKKNELLLNQIVEAEKLLAAEKKATESELKALKSQMNPHFIFNALNSIQEQFMYGDKQKANQQLNNFTYLTRQILEVSGKKLITIDTEIELLSKYLELEKMRFAQDFEYAITLANEIDADYQKIPPMLIQPFVENSIKHGLLHKKGIKNITINFKLDSNEEYIICTIIDNGVGRKKSEEIKAGKIKNHNSFSTKSIEERLNLLKNNSPTKNLITYYELSENEEITGTKVVIQIPLV